MKKNTKKLFKNKMILSLVLFVIILGAVSVYLYKKDHSYNGGNVEASICPGATELYKDSGYRTDCSVTTQD